MGVEIKDGKFWFNGKKKDFVLGRTSFKLANIVTYHYRGRGGGKWSLGEARRWVEHNQKYFGEDVVLRVFLETAGWGDCDDCMFGSEPRDQGFWNVDQLRTGHRPDKMRGEGYKTLEWFFHISEETGAAFELCIIATLKHTEGVTVGTQTHVVRQTLAAMREMQERYPNALIIPNVMNEWNAHSKWLLTQVNMLAFRADRWKHPDGRVHVGFTAPPGFQPEQWPGAPLIVDGGGRDTFDYSVGPEAGVFKAGMIHPERRPHGRNWWELPNLWPLKNKARGQPIGFNESMYYVEAEDVQRAERWYRNRSGWAHTWKRFEQFYGSWPENIDYGIVHDEKGAQCDRNWPRKETRVEAWARSVTGGVEPPPTLPEPPKPEPPPPTPDKYPVKIHILGYEIPAELEFTGSVPAPPAAEPQADGDDGSTA